MNCLCNFFRDNECLIWIIIALIVLASLSDGCGCGGSERTGGCGCGCGCTGCPHSGKCDGKKEEKKK